MSLAAHGAYRNLLDAAWDNGGKIPNNSDVIWRYALAQSKAAFAKVSEQVLSMFTVSEDGKWLTNETLTDEWNDATDWFKKKSDAGKKGSSARWANGDDMAPPCETDDVVIDVPMAKDSTSPHLTSPHHTNTVLKPSAKRVRGPNSPEQVMPVDSRHIRIKSLICNAYHDQTKLDCPWGPAEGAQLKRFLTENPSWLDSQIAQCLVNMYASSGFPKGTRPCQFLPRLTQYVSGPLNEFNREQSNGAGTSKAERRNADISETTRSVFDPSRHVHGDDAKSLPNKTPG